MSAAPAPRGHEVGWWLLPLLAACAREPGALPNPAAVAAAVAAPATPHQVIVFAAASLQAPFTALARRYEELHPGATVQLRCDGAAQLLAALLAGERADVVVLADSSVMSRVAGAALLAPGSATELARNRIALAVAKGNPRQVRGLADLARPDLRVALGARSASIGRHARWVLSRGPIAVQPQVEAATAAAVLAKVAADEADVGLVYATSFAAGVDAVQRIELPDVDNTPVLYSIALLREAAEPRGGAAFRALALGGEGRRLLAAAGFLSIGSK